MTHWLESLDIESNDVPPPCWATSKREPIAADAPRTSTNNSNRFIHFISGPSHNGLFFRNVLPSLAFGRWPADWHQSETPAFHVTVNARHLFFAQEAGPARHPLVLSAWHRDRENVVRSPCPAARTRGCRAHLKST